MPKWKKITEMIITNILLTITILAILVIMHDIGWINRAINVILKDGVSEETHMSIDKEDVEKIVNLVLDELEKRKR